MFSFDVENITKGIGIVTAYQIGTTSLGSVSDVFTILCASSSTGKDALASFLINTALINKEQYGLSSS